MLVLKRILKQFKHSCNYSKILMNAYKLCKYNIVHCVFTSIIVCTPILAIKTVRCIAVTYSYLFSSLFYYFIALKGCLSFLSLNSAKDIFIIRACFISKTIGRLLLLIMINMDGQI